MVYESAGAARAYQRRDNPPGMHGRARRPSNFGQALLAKQKIKHYYGLANGNSAGSIDSVAHRKATRASNVDFAASGGWTMSIRRAGFTKTRPQARQGDHPWALPGERSHGHHAFLYVDARGRDHGAGPREYVNLYRGIAQDAAASRRTGSPLIPETLRATVQGLPGPDDISLPVDVNIVIEFLSR